MQPRIPEELEQDTPACGASGEQQIHRNLCATRETTGERPTLQVNRVRSLRGSALPKKMPGVDGGLHLYSAGNRVERQGGLLSNAR